MDANEAKAAAATAEVKDTPPKAPGRGPNRDINDRRKGFAAMDPEKQAEIASMGGKRAHEKGTAHVFSSAEASAAGKKGGTTVAKDRKHMSDIGRLGGLANKRPKRRQEQDE
jgi:general stress protein YciG